MVRAAGEGFEAADFTVASEAVSTVEASAGAEASAEEAVLAEAEAVLAAEAPAEDFNILIKTGGAMIFIAPLFLLWKEPYPFFNFTELFFFGQSGRRSERHLGYQLPAVRDIPLRLHLLVNKRIIVLKGSA